MRTLTTLQASSHSTAVPNSRAGGRLARVRRAAAELTPQAIEQIAERVVQLLHREQPASIGTPAVPVGLLNASELAQRLGVTRAWVYEHAAELGAITLGDGPRPRLRFDPETAGQALANRRRSNPRDLQTSVARTRRRRPPQRAGSTVPLLPIHGFQARSVARGLHVTRRGCR